MSAQQTTLNTEFDVTIEDKFFFIEDYFESERQLDLKSLKTLSDEQLRALLTKELQSIDEAITKFKKIDIHQWKRNREETILGLNEMSQILSKVCKDTAIAQTSGGAAQIAGGVVGVVGLCLLNPIVAGIGVSIAVSGGVTSVTGAVTKFGWNKKKQQELKLLLAKDKEATSEIASIMRQLSDASQRLRKQEKFFSAAFAKLFASAGYGAFKTVSTPIKVKNTIEMWNLLKSASKIRVQAEVTGTLLNEGKFLGIAIFEAGSTAAKVLEITFSAINIVFGILDVIFGAKNLAKGSAFAKNIDEISKELDRTKEELVHAHERISRSFIEGSGHDTNG